MGGGPEVFETNKQYQSLSDELKHVTYYLAPSMIGNSALIDVNSILVSIRHDIDQYFKENGINHTDLGEVGGMGGGGGFLELLKELWEKKDLIALAITSIKFASILAKNEYRKRLENKTKPLYFRLNLNLSISSDYSTEKIGNDYLEDYLIKVLSNLLLVSYALHKQIIEKRSFLKLDIDLNASIKSKTFNFALYLPSEEAEKQKKSKMLSILKTVTIKNDLSKSFRIIWKIIIKRTDLKEGENKGKNYYFLTPSKLIKDYF